MYIASPAGPAGHGRARGPDELQRAAAVRRLRADRFEGRAVLLSTDAAGPGPTRPATPRRRASRASRPARDRVRAGTTRTRCSSAPTAGSSGPTASTATSRASATARGLSGVFLADCHAWLSRVPTRLEPINAGLGTLQLFGIALNPADKNLALVGTQDNGSLNFSGSDTWLLGVTGDGGDAGFDAANKDTSFHTYYTGWLDVNFRGDDPKSWLWVGDQFFPAHLPERRSGCTPRRSPTRSRRARSSRAPRTSGAPRTGAATRRSSRLTATRRTSSGRATCSSPAPAVTSSRSARR